MLIYKFLSVCTPDPLPWPLPSFLPCFCIAVGCSGVPSLQPRGLAYPAAASGLNFPLPHRLSERRLRFSLDSWLFTSAKLF